MRDAWIAWREEVEAGKTTFRFKGSQQCYHFDGPVEDAPSPRAARGPAVPPPIGSGEVRGRGGEAAPAESSGRNVALVVSGLILLAACAGWLWLRFKPKAA